MQNTVGACLIWGNEHEARGVRNPTEGLDYVHESPRAGGGYIFPYHQIEAADLGLTEKVRLTTWLIDQRQGGVAQPRVTEEIVDYLKNQSSLKVKERMDRLLRFMSEKSERVGASVEVSEGTPAEQEALAWSESVDRDELIYFLHSLEEMGFLKAPVALRNISPSYVVTLDGYNHIGL